MNLLSKIMSAHTIRNVYIGWVLLAIFYLYQYTLRIAPGVLVDEIRESYCISAESFATLGSFYLLGYALIQIPLGIMVDKLGVKRVAIVSLNIMILCSLVMSFSSVFLITQIARFVMGVAGGSAFLCTLKFATDHAPIQTRSFLMGATLSTGIAGAIIFAYTFSFLDTIKDWRNICFYIGLCGVPLALLLTNFVIDTKKNANETYILSTSKFVLRDLIRILINKRIMIFSILTIGLYTPLAALADLWGTAFLKQKFDLASEDAAQVTMMLYVGLGIGSLVLPLLSTKQETNNLHIAMCTWGLLACFCLLLYSDSLTIAQLYLLLILTGFLCGAEMMCFSGALEPRVGLQSGQIIGVVNTLNMLGGAIIQQVIGFILDMQWDGTLTPTGLRHYSAAQFQSALSIMLAILGVCGIFAIKLVRENATD